MGAVYRALLRKVERAGSEVLDRRVRVSAARRLAIAAATLLRCRLATGLGRTR
jgi:phytoene synthase